MSRGERLSAATSDRLTRREFVTHVGSAIAGVALAGIPAACTGGKRAVTAPTPQGSVAGTVVDMQGNRQSIGRIYLLQKNGLNVGVYADADPSGGFTFGAVDAGDYLLRYWGGNQAQVPEQFHNPVRISVRPETTSFVSFVIAVGAPGTDRDIYAGDNFFQEQPVGEANGTVVVKLGTTVCWYNVGTVRHTITGAPWGDSGPLEIDGNFMWTTDRVGTFPYRCTFHAPQMQATLQVVP